MVRLSFLSRALPGVPADRLMARLAESGYDGVEICAPDLHSRGIESLAAHHGLSVSGFHPDLSAVNPFDSGAGPAYHDAFDRALEQCARIGSHAITIDSGSPADTLSTFDYFKALDHVASLWHRCAVGAAAAGIMMLWEFEPTLIYHRPSEVLNLHRRVDHPNFRILFNTAHAYLGAKSSGGAPEFLRKIEDRVGALHLSDTDGSLRRPLEDGIIDFRGLAPQLLEIKTGWWCADLCGCVDVWDLIEPTREFMADLANSRTAA